MDKVIKYILIVLLAMMALWLGVFMVFGITNGGFEFGNFDTLIKEEKYDLKEIKDLKFSFVSSDVKFLVSEDDQLRVVQYGNKKSKEFIDNVSSNSIEISDDTKMNFIFFNFQYGSRYEIYLPSSYSNNLDIRTVSGEINLDDFKLNLKDFNIKTTSGDISIDSIIESKDTQIKSVSGEIRINELTNSDSIIKTTSGNINIDKLKSKDITMSSISGELELGNIEGILDLNTTSGDISINNFKMLDSSDISTISGEVRIGMDADNNCIVTTHSLSGDSDIRTNKFGSKQYDLNIKTTSGDIRVD